MNNKKNKIAAIYTKDFSTYKDKNKSLEIQSKICIQEAKQRGYEISRIYTDNENEQTEFLQMLKDMKNQKFEVLIIAEFSRISRKNRYLSEFFKQFENSNINLISIAQQINTAIPIGRLMFNLIGTFIESKESIL